MAFSKFKKIKIATDDPVINRAITQLQDNIDTSVSPIIDKIQLDSSILQNIQLVPNQVNIIPHTLQRVLVGWTLVRCRAQADVWDVQDNNLSPDLYLYLFTSAPVSVDIEVF